MSEQLKLFIYNNQNLFSNNYLESQLPQSSIWKKHTTTSKKQFNEISKIYNEIKNLNLGPGEEANLEDKFIRPILKILGWEYDVQPITERGTKKKRPDYALFLNKDLLEEARAHKDNLKFFYTRATSILEAKYWNRKLNDSDSQDRIDKRDPTAQTVLYLEDAHIHSDMIIDWAILTNGKLWRLFYYRASSKTSNYYEVDLESIIHQGDIEKFQYFYLFFSKQAFIKDTKTNLSILDFHLNGSEEYAKRVSNKLKDLIFEEIFEDLATGFTKFRKNELKINTETEEILNEIFKGSLILLFRFLFLLYAESRNLLPIEDQYKYYQKSLKKLKEDIIKDIQTLGLDNISKSTYDYYQKFETICKIIDKGNVDLNVPIYNGGLFTDNEFLNQYKISDYYFAKVIKNLTLETETIDSLSHPKFIDYSSLGVRQLGDIYEGLLEFQLKIAETDLTEINQKGKSIYVPIDKVNKPSEKIKKKGEVYIQSYKHGRKISGSYYTPEFIVKYIIENTLKPVLDNRFKKSEEILKHLDKLYKKQRKRLNKPDHWHHWDHQGEPLGPIAPEINALEEQLFKTLFDIKVLDPAMGSGHFLVNAVDFIAENITTFLAQFPDNPVLVRINQMKNEILESVKKQGVQIDETKLTEINLIKRLVMKKCIYGIDLNEMAVELAKLSLWLDSFTLGAPLSFLDHHLKCGNSLMGSTLEKLEKSLEGILYGINTEPLKRAIKDLLLIEDLTDNTFDEILQSRKFYIDAFENIKGYKLLLDILTVYYLGYKECINLLRLGFDKINLNKFEESISKLDKKDKDLIEEVKEITKNYNFFHYDIEFPEIFYEGKGITGQQIDLKDNKGFDVVIGNPPWERVKLQENEFFSVHKQEIALAQKSTERKKLIIQLKIKNPDIYSKYLNAKEKSELISKYFRDCNDYPFLSKGDINYYSIFVEKSISLINNKGFFGMVIPSGIASDKTASKYFNYLIENRQLSSLIDFENREGHFTGIDRRFKFSIMIISGQEHKQNRIKMAFYLHNIAELNEERIIEFEPVDFELINPNTKSAPVIRHQIDFKILKKVYKRIPILLKRDKEDKIVNNPWGIKFLRMFDMTNDAIFFKTKDELKKKDFWQNKEGYFIKGNEKYIPLYEGKMIQIYDSRAANIIINPENIHRPAYQIPTKEEEHKNFNFKPEPQYYVPEEEVIKRLPDNTPKWLIGYKNVCSPTNERTFIVSLIPFSGVGNSLPLILSEYKDEKITLLIANLSSFILDFIVRQKVGGQNLNYFIVEQLPVLPPEYYNKKISGITIGNFIKKRVLKLIYTGYDLKEFAKDMGYHKKPFTWNEKERLHLQCQLDALFFMLYEIEKDELIYIMDTFPIIKKQDETKYGKYIRKHLILEYYKAYKSGNFDAKVKE